MSRLRHSRSATREPSVLRGGGFRENPPYILPAMQAFAALLDRLVLTPARNGKLRLLDRLFPHRARSRPRLCAGGADRRSLDRQRQAGDAPRPVVERLDEVLFGYSYDYVGDLAETIALVWPGAAGSRRAAATCREVVEALQAASRSDGPRLVERWLDRLDASGRYALIKLVTGGLRVGVTARLAKQALARFGGKDVDRDRGNLARPEAALCRVLRLAGGEGRAARQRGALAVPPGHARACDRRSRSSKSSTRRTTPPNGSGTASASRR